MERRNAWGYQWHVQRGSNLTANHASHRHKGIDVLGEAVAPRETDGGVCRDPATAFQQLSPVQSGCDQAAHKKAGASR